MNKFVFLFKIILVISIFCYIYIQGYFDFSFFYSILNNLFYFSILLFLSFITIILASLRWYLILKNSKFNVNFINIFNIVYIGTFFNNVLFGSYGGDLVRIYYMYKASSNNKFFLSFSVLIDRVIGLCGLGIIIFFCIFFIIDKNYLIFKNLITVDLFFYFLILLILTLIFLFLFFIIFKKQINNLFSIINFNFSIYFLCLIVSVILFIIVNLMIFLIILYFFEFEINIINVFISNSLATISNIIPITPGGLGIGELVFVKTNNFLIDENNIYNLANVIIIFRIVNFIVSIPASFIYMNYRHKELLRNREK